MVKFRDVLSTIMEASDREWVYLPSDRNWNLESKSAVLLSEEVPPELENEPDAGIPQFAKENGLIPVIPVASLREVVFNARVQKPTATDEDLFTAFRFFYDHDAFMDF